MRQVVIENPVLNSPYEESRRHFRFSEDGITDEIVEARRPSSYFVPVPQPRKRNAKQLALDSKRDGEAFFLRHAYFTDADRPYQKLRRVLRAEVDEAARNTLYGAVSRPFARPGAGRITGKAMNHHGMKCWKSVRSWHTAWCPPRARDAGRGLGSFAALGDRSFRA
ncbi:MAG: hypothetical protein K6V36_11435 [Anaerolineae bacterium]|nr:hypothetical protein [Anaerolineae bacterium]